MFEYLEFICPGFCLLFCLIHFVIELLVAHKQNKKIDHLCDKCGLPVYENSSHICPFDYEQLSSIFVYPQEGSIDEPNAIVTTEQIKVLRSALKYFRDLYGDKNG